jgi:hypothetical protein
MRQLKIARGGEHLPKPRKKDPGIYTEHWTDTVATLVADNMAKQAKRPVPGQVIEGAAGLGLAALERAKRDLERVVGQWMEADEREFAARSGVFSVK